MSIRLEMLQVARVAAKTLGDSAGLVREFLRGQQRPDGGFQDRVGQSDLYYTVFGLDGLLALDRRLVKSSPGGAPDDLSIVFERVRPYLNTFGDGAGLDLVHLCCLARAWAATTTWDRFSTPQLEPERRIQMLRRIEQFRSSNGGYNAASGSESGTAYGCFLALSAYQDLHCELPDPSGLVRSLQQLETADGAWTNELVAADPHAALGASVWLSMAAASATPGSEPALSQSAIRSLPSATGSTNATAAAVTVLHQLSQPIQRQAEDWLLARAHAQGGFLAVPMAPIPDLLSTATALHALAGLQVSIEPVREACLDFVDSLWTNAGAFYGHWQDDSLDVEYTYYALLALGHLSL